VPRALIALAVGAFALGTTEFLMMGLLPQVATDLGVSVPAAGLVISAYAVGVVVGAPTLTALAVRLPLKHVLLGLMVLFTAGHVAMALAPGYGAVVAARLVTGLSHGAYFGVGAVVARSVVPPERAARAIALMFAGLTLANVVGVPAGTALGQVVSWRVAFAAVGALGLLTVLAVSAWVPPAQGGTTSLRAELAAFRRPQVLLALAVTTVGTGALFAVYSYVAPILTDLTGLGERAVVGVLVVFGIGTTAGTLLGGALADRFPMPTVVGCLLAVAAVLGALTLTVTSPVAAVATLVAFGVVAFAIGSPLQSRVITASGGAALLVSAANQGAFNTDNAVGAFLGAEVLDAGLGYRATMVVGIALALGGAALAALALWLERSGRAPLHPAPEPVREAATAVPAVPAGR
jgi:DHA1 family inner membrane transport protein